MACSKHFLTYFWLPSERRWRQYRSQVCLSGELASLSHGCVFVDVSKVDATEWVNTIWAAALLDPDQSSPLTGEDDLAASPNPRPHQAGARATNQIHPPTLRLTCPPALHSWGWGRRPMEESRSAALLLLFWGSREGLEAFLGFN